MFRWVILFATFFFSYSTHSQILSQSAADELLPAFRNDDSTLFKSSIHSQTADGTIFLQLASLTNAPRIFSYVLDNYSDTDPELAILLALQYANRSILEIALQKSLSLGKFPVNTLLAPAWMKKDDDAPPFELVLELILNFSLPEKSVMDYSTLINDPSDDSRSKVAAWLVDHHQAFDYNETANLTYLTPTYQPVVESLVQELYNLPPNQSINGFTSPRQALLYFAVQRNDLVALKSLAEDAETLEFTGPDNHSLFSYAIIHSDLSLIKYLLSRDINPNYQHAESGRSVLNALLKRQDRAILQTVMPYIKTTAIRFEDGSTPVYYCVHSFFQLKPSAANESQRQFYLSALKALRHNGSDFNEPSRLYNLPIQELQKTLEDSLARSIALLVLEQTTDEWSLRNYASNFVYTTPADLPILSLLCQQMKDPGDLFYNDDLEKAGLFPWVLQEVKQLPTLETFSILLRSAANSKNVQQVRWLLNEVPMAYLNRNPSMNPDSLRQVIVNTPIADESVLYYFLSQEHTVSWESKSVMKALMAAGANLYQLQTIDGKRPIDLLLESEYYQKQYANEILSGLLKHLTLRCDDSGSWEPTSTGDLYRKSITAFQQDRKLLMELENCVTMDLSGGGVTAKPNRRVKIEGVGVVALGSFPVNSCMDLNLDVTVGNPPRYVYDFKSNIEIIPYSIYIYNNETKEAASLRLAINVQGSLGLKKMAMSVSSVTNIPGTIMDTSNHSIPPMIFIRNNGDPVIIYQQDVPSYLSKGQEQFFDRSKGSLRVVYERNHAEIDSKLEIFSCIQDTEFPDLVVPQDNSPVSRLRLYAEIVRLQNRINNNPLKTTTDQIYRKQDEVLIHLLSEYALQRYYPRKVKEEYDQNRLQLADINRLMEPLGLFYQQYSILDFNNVSQLKKTLQDLLEGTALNEQQRRDYTLMLQRLEQATQLSQLSDTYAQLMNSELLRQAEKQLDDKNRIISEAALYEIGGHLKLDH